MNAKELEEKLNAIDDHFQFQIEEYDKDTMKGKNYWRRHYGYFGVSRRN